jgi:hypothetical protein
LRISFNNWIKGSFLIITEKARAIREDCDSSEIFYIAFAQLLTGTKPRAAGLFKRLKGGRFNLGTH